MDGAIYEFKLGHNSSQFLNRGVPRNCVLYSVQNVCNASLFGLTYRFLQYFAVFSANSKDEPRLPSEMIKSQGDSAGDHLQRKLSRESCPNGDEIDPQQTRFCYRVG